MHGWFVARQVGRLARSRELTRLGPGLAACAALLLAGCGGASPRPSAPAVAATPPEQVERPVQSDRTPSSITVSWRAPASAGEITYYELRWRPAGDGSWTVVPEIASSERNYAISGLQGGAEYEAQVRAVSAAGPGEWSESLQVSTTTGGVTPPNQPGILSTGTITSGSAVITWSVPETELTIVRYLVQWIEAPSVNTTARAAAQGGIDWTNAESAETEDDTPSITLDGLDPGTTYLVRVRAVTAEVDGLWSEPIEVTTSAEGGTGTGGEVVTGLPAPTGLQGTATGETEIDVMWDAVTAPDGFTLTGYTVEWRQSGTLDRDSASAGNSTSYTITGLSAGTTYQLRVTSDGTDSTGASVSSAPSGEITVVTDGGGIQTKPILRVYAIKDDSIHGDVSDPLTIPKSDGEARFKIFSIHSMEYPDLREAVTHDISVFFSPRTSGVSVTEKTASPVVMKKGSNAIDIIVKWDKDASMTRDGWGQVSILTNSAYEEWDTGIYRVKIDHDA